MPRQLVKPPGSSRMRSLGWLATWWIETFVVQGPGDVEGEAIVHGDEYTNFIVDCYALEKKTGRRLVDSAFFSRPKGANKSGLGAEIALFEALGPARFAGWAKGGETFEYLGLSYEYEKGEPMGRQVKSPVVRVLATEETQTGNVFDQIYLNLDEGPLSQLKAYGMQVNKTLIQLPTSGTIIPSTAGAASKDGGKETFAVFDESHLYNTNGLRQMHATVVRNLGKRGKTAEPWYLETTTMYLPGEDSVAEKTFEYAQILAEDEILKAAGQQPVSRRTPKMLYDHRWGECVDLADEEALREAIIDAYGEAMDWNSVETLMDKIYDPRNEEAHSRRFFLNALTDAHNAWVSPTDIDACAVPISKGGIKLDNVDLREKITLGFDGALTNDATALMGCRVSDGALFVIRIEEKPDGPEAKDWIVDQVAFDAQVKRTFERYNVVGFFADPPYWQDYIDNWEKEWGEELQVKASPGNVIKWWTKRDVPMSLALERLHQAIGLQQVMLEDHPVLKRHFKNARNWERRGGLVIGKDSKNSVKKIDAAMASTLAYEARAAYLHHGLEQPDMFVPRRVR